MASRLKKILHRKSQNLQPDSLQGENMSTGGPSDPALRATPYDATAPGGLPETGAYPIRADGSSTAVQGNVHSSYNRGHQPTSTSNQPTVPQDPLHSTVDPRIDRTYPRPSSNVPPSAFTVKDRPRGRDSAAETPLAQEFSGLSLGDGDARATQTPPRTNFQAPSNSVGSNSEQYATDQTSSTGVYEQDSSPHVSHNISSAGAHTPARETRQRPSNEFQDDPDLRRRTSIPRKQVGSSPKAHYSDNVSPTAPTAISGPDPRTSVVKPLPSAPASNYNSYQPGRGEDLIPSPSVLDRSRPISRSTGGGGAYAAEDVVQRAQHDSADTEVIERIAPAVIHENIQNQVHHIREEVITREIHDHDIYHRILPVVDVEVLPPRHFLPVEGGGLVEISASEVPGRGKNWVIAETASKIPSDQAAPMVPTRFSAREFYGTEGDTKRYETPKGTEITEQTWVHPPELETGGRDSDQTWPMIFGDAAPGKHHRGPSSGTPQNIKGHRKSSSKTSMPLAGADQPGRAK